MTDRPVLATGEFVETVYDPLPVFLAERNGNGQKLFRFYQDLITLSRRLRSIRSHTIDILHQSNFNRVAGGDGLPASCR